jgi:hypothetical protein
VPSGTAKDDPVLQLVVPRKSNFRYWTGLPKALARSPLLPESSKNSAERSRVPCHVDNKVELIVWSPIAPD